MDALFEVHMLNDAGKAKALLIAEAFNGLLIILNGGMNPNAPLCPSGRELAIVKTKLEEACFFAKKAMANVAENQLNVPAVK
jgi:hypothetical protein